MTQKLFKKKKRKSLNPFSYCKNQLSANVILIFSKCLYPTMHLLLDGHGAFQDVNVPINTTQMVNQRFEQHDRSISHVSSHGFLNLNLTTEEAV